MGVGVSEPLYFQRTDDGIVRIGESFPLSIEVDGRFLDMATRGATKDGAVSVSGHVEPIEGAPSFPLMIWDSITFTCVNGTATYDFIPQEGEDFRRDIWRGVRRDIVDNVMAGLTDA